MHGISKITKCKINGTGVVGKTRSDLALEKKSANFHRWPDRKWALQARKALLQLLAG